MVDIHKTRMIELPRGDGIDGIVEFNVPLDTLYVISETVLRVRRPNQQCYSTEGRWLVNHFNCQSYQAQLTKR